MPFNEERTEFKKLQPISPFVYWTSVYLFDVAVHMLFCSFLYCVHMWIDTHHVFDTDEYGNYIYLQIATINRGDLMFFFLINFQSAAMFFLIYLFYGVAYLPIIYMVSQVFSTMSSIYSFLTYIFVIFCK